ncbi:668_t:CDS:1 [Acaulospora morrowiae]|uniref:668_t:CDS:1 n=1 Tax=Acaulospora morrowiae TaxID=94023 RepID=A0A9N8VCV7_9GLOM|nr:668_t:CDS:1 [Acaulospora morrowiae]
MQLGMEIIIISFITIALYFSCVTLYCLYGRNNGSDTSESVLNAYDGQPDKLEGAQFKRSKLEKIHSFFRRLHAEKGGDSYHYIPLNSVSVVDEDEFSEVCVEPVFIEKLEIDVIADSDT